MLLTLLACADLGASDHGIPFALPIADLGDPLAASTGFDAADGDAVGLVIDQALPVFGEEEPAWSTPMAIWDLLSRETVADPGTCPFDKIEDGFTVHDGNGCRSTDGYVFDGQLAEKSWESDGVSYTRIEADLTVTGDTEGVVFDTVTFTGTIERAVPDDDSVDAHLDVNLALSVLGYWEQRDADDPRLTAWADWAVSGTIEQAADTTTTDVSADIGASGGLYLASSALVARSTCPIEAVGEVTLSDTVTATLEGVDACDACATLSSGASACDPDR